MGRKRGQYGFEGWGGGVGWIGDAGGYARETQVLTAAEHVSNMFGNVCYKGDEYPKVIRALLLQIMKWAT
jgi:hypothetical protein